VSTAGPRRHVLAATALVVLAGAGLLLDPARADGSAVLSSGMQHVTRVPLPGAVSVAFDSRRPVAYVVTREHGGTVATVDMADPRRPRVLGTLAVPSQAYMEDVSVGERPDGTTFLLVREVDGVRVVDVTDPGAPRSRGFLDVESHTWTCVDAGCSHAYGTRNGFTGTGVFAVVDLTDLDAPRTAALLPSAVGVVHDWDRDAAGVVWAAGGNGLAAYDVTDPTRPVLVATSDAHGTKGHSEHNDQVQLHGTQRPHADRYRAGHRRDGASLERGNVLLVSEEGNDVDCTDTVQTWHVPHLDPALAAAESPDGLAGRGSVTPLDTWSLEDAPASSRPPVSLLCSVHWFDARSDGFVVVPTYGSGTRVLDLREPLDIRQVAFHVADRVQAIQSRWVPERDGTGRATGRASRFVVTADVGTPTGFTTSPDGGLDVFEVDASALAASWR